MTDANRTDHQPRHLPFHHPFHQRVPVVLVTGVSPEAMAAAVVGMQFDLPAAVAVHHHIDVDAQVLTRTVSDVTGVIERERIELEHACVGCAVREDVVPTLARLAADGRWASIVAHLPVAAEARQVCRVLAGDARVARHLRISSVLAAVDGPSAVDDLVGDDLLHERGLHTSAEDRRGVGEVAAAIVEYADSIVLVDDADARARGLVTALARPDVRLVTGVPALDTVTEISGRHRHSVSERWTDPARAEDLPALTSPAVWRVDLRSVRAFHPDRLLDGLGALAGGRTRSRGCFWLPTRPGQVLAWDGAGGQLSVGPAGTWGRLARRTRIVVVGVGEPDESVAAAFEPLLLEPAEAGGGRWAVGDDGFEPWLGPIRGVA